MMPPVIALVVMIYMGRSLMQAAFWSIILTLGCSLLRAHTRIGMARLVAGLEEAARGVIAIAVACAAAGIIEGIINLTGLGFTLSATLTAMAQGEPLILLLLIMLVALLLGMALPPTAVYLVLAGLSVPSMVAVGVEPIAAHFFIFFFSSMGAITPPVALAAYAAAALSGAGVDRTGWLACRLGLAGYVIPFLGVYYTGILLIGNARTIVVETLIAAVVIIATAMAIHFVNIALQPKRAKAESTA